MNFVNTFIMMMLMNCFCKIVNWWKCLLYKVLFLAGTSTRGFEDGDMLEARFDVIT